jgi:hypothetical protein
VVAEGVQLVGGPHRLGELVELALRHLPDDRLHEVLEGEVGGCHAVKARLTA